MLQLLTEQNHEQTLMWLNVSCSISTSEFVVFSPRSRKDEGLRSKVTLTVDRQTDGSAGARVQVRVSCQAGVVSSLVAEDPFDGELRPVVDLGVVAEPDEPTDWIGPSVT